MRSIGRCGLAIVVLPLLTAGGPRAAPPGTDGYRLVWHDEFEGETIDRAKWTFDLGGHGWGNNELELYTDRPENAHLENGTLVIEARREELGGSSYTSARLKTQGLAAWTGGRIEARMQVPSGPGLWPAFWALGADIAEVGWPDCGEIDIMESIGREPFNLYGTVHGPGYSGADGVGGRLELTDRALHEDFHVFAVEWEAAEIRWLVDGRQYFRLTPDDLPGRWVFDHPFFLLFNVAVGGDWPGSPDATTVFPQRLRVDWVRVSQRVEGQQ